MRPASNNAVASLARGPRGVTITSQGPFAGSEFNLVLKETLTYSTLVDPPVQIAFRSVWYHVTLRIMARVMLNICWSKIS